jgi:energy-coupling factor transporter transmembrane protein EcfT
MTQTQQNVVEVKPQANIYTVLVIVALIALIAAAVIVAMNLTTPVAEGGYGLEFGDLFKPLTDPLTGAE